MPPADADLVDGDLPQVLEFGLGKAALEVSLLNLLDQVPAHAQMLGCCRYSHLAEILPGTPQGQIGTRDFESIGVFVDRLEPLACHWGQGTGIEEHAIAFAAPIALQGRFAMIASDK